MTTDEDELASRAQGRIGTVLRGKYRIDKVLGAGGMAVVYKATHRNEAEFAVKMLHPELSIREDVRTRFLREGRAANSVKHPGVVVVVDDDVAEDGAAFLVMELLSGAAVETLWEQGGYRLPLRAVLAVGDQLLDVLAAAHDKGIVHRDIKPPNLFITKDGTLKVLDFGIARVKDVTGDSGSGHKTGTGMLLGTPAFMAPEQAYAKASEIDGQTDVWAVGATLFTLLTGQPVHEGENASQLMIHAATVRARPLASLVSNVPPAIAQVIDRALAFEKASRWGSAKAMQEALASASIDVFGQRPSKGVLASLLTGEDVGHAATQVGDGLVITDARTGGTGPAPSVQARTANPLASKAPLVAPNGPRLLASGSTARPVSSEPIPHPPVHGTAGRGAVIAVALVVLAVGGVAVRAVLGGRQEPAPAAVGLVALASSVAPVSSPPSTPVPTPGAASIEVTATAVPVTVTPLRERPPKRGPRAVDLPTPAVEPRPVKPLAPVPLATSLPSARATNCNPPTWTDEAGHVHIKQGCE